MTNVMFLKIPISHNARFGKTAYFNFETIFFVR